jgi:FkbM family methyltransferase
VPSRPETAQLHCFGSASLALFDASAAWLPNSVRNAAIESILWAASIRLGPECDIGSVKAGLGPADKKGAPLERHQAANGKLFMDSATIRAKNLIEPTFLCRVERKFRRTVLGQPNPQCFILKRLYRFPFIQRLLGRTIVEAPGIRRTLNFRLGTTDIDVIRYVFREQAFSITRLQRWSEIQTFLDAQHKRGRRPLIVDAGAHIGISTTFLALMFPTALVIALEPEGSNFDLLSKNTEGLNVRCIQAALSSEAHRVRVLDPGEGHWGFRTESTDSEEGLPCVTLNALYDEFCAPQVFPFLVKINIEGAEQELFSQNTDWVRNTGIVIIELHDKIFPKKAISRPFLKCVSVLDRDFLYSGFNVFSIDNRIFTIA